MKYGHGPVEMKCPVCDKHIRTQVKATNGKGAYACCFGMMAVWYENAFHKRIAEKRILFTFTYNPRQPLVRTLPVPLLLRRDQDLRPHVPQVQVGDRAAGGEVLHGTRDALRVQC